MGNYTKVMENILIFVNRAHLERLIVVLIFILLGLLIWKTESLEVILNFIGNM